VLFRSPTTTVDEGSASCEAIQFNDKGPLVVGIVVAVALVIAGFVVYGAVMDMLRSQNRLHVRLLYFAFLVDLVLPIIDVFTDFYYLLTAKFAHVSILVIMDLSYAVPSSMFVRRLWRYGFYPALLYRPKRIWFLCLAKYVFEGHERTKEGQHWVWSPHFYEDAFANAARPSEGNQPAPAPEQRRPPQPQYRLIIEHENRRLCPLCAVDHGDVSRVLLSAVLWVFYIALQAAFLIVVSVLLLLQVVLFVPIWWFFGVVLFWAKADAMTSVWNIWLYVWTGSHKFDARFDPETDEDGRRFMVDTRVLNGSMFLHFMYEAIPHLILQSVNNMLIHEPWSAFKVFSTMLSAYHVIAGMYLFVNMRYGCLWGNRSVPLEEIPQILSVFGLTLLQLPAARKSHPLPLRSRNPVQIASSYDEPVVPPAVDAAPDDVGMLFHVDVEHGPAPESSIPADLQSTQQTPGQCTPTNPPAIPQLANDARGDLSQESARQLMEHTRQLMEQNSRLAAVIQASVEARRSNNG